MIKVACWVSQGSVATYVMCGGKHDKGIIENLLINAMEKEVSKSANQSIY